MFRPTTNTAVITGDPTRMVLGSLSSAWDCGGIFTRANIRISPLPVKRCPCGDVFTPCQSEIRPEGCPFLGYNQQKPRPTDGILCSTWNNDWYLCCSPILCPRRLFVMSVRPKMYINGVVSAFFEYLKHIALLPFYQCIQMLRIDTAARLLLPLLRSMNLLWGSELSTLTSISSGHAKSEVAIILFLRNHQGAGNQSPAVSPPPRNHCPFGSDDPP